MSHPLFDIHGQTALVTGSSRGIGRALAQGLLEAGCTVVLHGRDSAAVERAAGELAGIGAPVHTAAFDVTDEEAVVAGLARIDDDAGPLDILVNNAGMQHREALLDVPADTWRRVVDTNLTSAFLVSRAAARGMVARERGRIVNVCSLMSEHARTGVAPYTASKGGLKMLTQAMCAEWGPSGIQVNGIGPGYFATELTRALVEDEAFDTWVRERTPAGRWGELDDLVGALLFLVSPAASFVNGQVVYVDGGMSAVL